MKYRRFIITNFLTLLCCFSFAQISNDLIKYWHYRDRLKYFVVPGNKIGESQIISVRNKIWAENDPNTLNEPENKQKSKNADYGQAGKYQGYYIGVLATEYYLLNKNGQYEDAANTYNELFLSLNAVKVYWDEQAESFWSQWNNNSDVFNGFFIRGNVPCDFFNPAHPNGITGDGQSHLELLNQDLSPWNTWQGNDQYPNATYYFFDLPRGHPGYTDHRTHDDCCGHANSSQTPNHYYQPEHPDHPHDFHPESMSKDEAIFILMGCELTIKLTGGSAAMLAQEMKSNIIERLVNAYQAWGSEPYRLYEPCGYKIKDWEGGNSLMYAKPLNIELGLPPTYNDDIVWAILSWGPFGDTDLTAILAAMSNSWANTGASIHDITFSKNHDTFYTLLWEVLQNESRPQNKQNEICNKALDQLNAAPCEGPYCYMKDTKNGNTFNNDGIYSGNGWASTYKWSKDTDEQDHGDWFTGNYSGTDYMLLYNLYHIINYQSCPYYMNYADKKLSHYLPVLSYSSYHPYGTALFPALYSAFNTITSKQTIGLQTYPVSTYNPGHVTYVAEKSIKLLPGFHAAYGTYFHAYLSHINCDGSSEKSMEAGEKNIMYASIQDSLESIQKTPYDLKITEEEKTDKIIYIDCMPDSLDFKGLIDESYDSYSKFFWDFGNGQTSTVREPKTLYEPGTYKFKVVISNNKKNDTICGTFCISTCKEDAGSDKGFVNDKTISNATEDDFEFGIYPNPNQGQMELLCNKELPSASRICIINNTGSVLYNTVLKQSSQSINISMHNAASGIYNCIIFNAEGEVIGNSSFMLSGIH